MAKYGKQDQPTPTNNALEEVKTSSMPTQSTQIPAADPPLDPLLAWYVKNWSHPWVYGYITAFCIFFFGALPILSSDNPAARTAAGNYAVGAMQIVLLSSIAQNTLGKNL